MISPASERLAATKRGQLRRATWNGLFGSEEWAQNFSRVSSALEPEALAPPDEQLAALDYLHEAEARRPLRDGPVDAAAPRALRDHLQALNQRPYTAQMLRTLLLAEQRLMEANALLDQALSIPDHCPAAGFTADLQQPPEARRLADWLEALDDAAEAWLTGLAPLFASLEAPPEAVEAYRRAWLSRLSSEAPLASFRQAMQGHLERRRRLATRC